MVSTFMPQGSDLDPILFITYIDDLHIMYKNVLVYSEDATMRYHGNIWKEVNSY